MKLNVLIAVPQDIVRVGLSAILCERTCVEHVFEAKTKEDLSALLASHTIDFVVVHQCLISDISILPKGGFVIITSELDMTLFQAAYKHGAKGYLLENIPAEFLLYTLGLPDEAFLIEPTITSQILGYMSNDLRSVVDDKLLTPREKEIVNLLSEGYSRPSIAKMLYISEATLKTHIKNITKKGRMAKSYR